MRARLFVSLSSLASLLALSACKSDGTASEGGSETSPTSGIATLGDGDGDPGDGDGEPGDGDGSPGDGDGDGDGESAECGNGVVEPGETCDDGNTMSGDGCSASCHTEGPIECMGQIYECGDTLDNDGDGLFDLEDPECISPCDDDESTFRTNLPGQAEDCKSDCYWDADSGSGQDKCEWNLKCDPANPGAEIGCEYNPDQMNCDPIQVQTCLDVCTPLIPNGCDCFGCCEIAGQFVYLDGAQCALDNLGGCSSCTFNEQCGNPCMPEICELCFGQDPEELPEECDEPECPDHLDPCLDTSECAEGMWCQTGCCVPINIP